MNRRNFLQGLVLACPIAAKLPVADRQTIAVRLISRWGAVYTLETTITSFDLTTYCFSTDELPSCFNEITHVQLVAFGKLQPPVWIRDTAHLYFGDKLIFRGTLHTNGFKPGRASYDCEHSVEYATHTFNIEGFMS